VKIVDEFGNDDPLPPSSMCKTVRRGRGEKTKSRKTEGTAANTGERSSHSINNFSRTYDYSLTKFYVTPELTKSAMDLE